MLKLIEIPESIKNIYLVDTENNWSISPSGTS